MALHQSRLDLLQGTLDLLILRALHADSMHGWAISERIQQISHDVLQVNQGSLYPPLHRLEHRGWVRAEWGVSELGRRARVDSLTAAGRKQLEAGTEKWNMLTEAKARVFKMAGNVLERFSPAIACVVFPPPDGPRASRRAAVSSRNASSQESTERS